MTDPSLESHGEATEPSDAQAAVALALLTPCGHLTTEEFRKVVDNVLAALRSLPVDRRMAALGMVVYGTVEYDDENEEDVIHPVVDVMPGADVYVDETLVCDA